MAFLVESFARGAFKRLNSLAHTGNHRDPSNESILSGPLIVASKGAGRSINQTPATAVTEGTVELVTLDLTVISGSNNLAYDAKFQAGYSGAFGAGAQGQLLRAYSFAIPKAWSYPITDVDNSGWAPIMKTAGAVTIPESDAADWYFDPVAGVVVAETAFGTAPATIKTYIYIGATIQAQIDSLPRAGEVSISAGDVSAGYKDVTFATPLANANFYAHGIIKKTTALTDILVTFSPSTRATTGVRFLGITQTGTLYYAAIPYR